MAETDSLTALAAAWLICTLLSFFHIFPLFPFWLQASFDSETVKLVNRRSQHPHTLIPSYGIIYFFTNLPSIQSLRRSGPFFFGARVLANKENEKAR